MASSYTEGMLYQDNILPDLNREDGHQVLVVSDCTCYVNGKLSIATPIDKILENGVRLIRLQFSGRWLPKTLRDKIRFVPDLHKILDDFGPDVILHHSVVGMTLLTVGKYAKHNPTTRLYLDSHADSNNSGQSFFSLFLQYKIFNKILWNKISAVVKKVLYVSHESREFLRENYGIPEERMEFFPLGGFLTDQGHRAKIKKQVRKELNINDRSVVLIHTGKFDEKKKTINVLRSFTSLPIKNIQLLLIGKFDEQIQAEAEAIISHDHRIKNLGWKSGNELLHFLMASDVYLQPGSQSATLQAAICCGLPVVVRRYPSHQPYLNGNGFYVESNADLAEVIFKLKEKNLIKKMSIASLAIAENILDYKKIARRIYY